MFMAKHWLSYFDNWKLINESAYKTFQNFSDPTIKLPEATVRSGVWY